MMRLVLLLFVLFMMFITIVHSQSFDSFDVDTSLCCNSQPGPRVVPLPVNLEEIANESPNYVQMLSENSFSQDLDSVCYTYFPIGNETYLVFAGMRYSNGSFVIEKYIIADLIQYPGVLRSQGLSQKSGSSTVMLDTMYLGRACPGLRVYYKQYRGARCNNLRSFNQGQTDFVQAESPTRDVTNYCKWNVSSVISCQPFSSANLRLLPNCLNRVCVTKVNGVSCINEDWVLPQDTHILPNLKSSCSTYSIY